MSLVAYDQSRQGDLVLVTVTSDLAGTVYYHWWADGLYLGRTESPQWTFRLSAGGMLRVECVDTLDPDYDPTSASPTSSLGRRTLYWTSPEGGCDHYLVEEKIGAGSYATLGRVWHDSGRWEYFYTTGLLTDLATYTWRITPVDELGNSGTAITVGPEKVVRVPDAPNATIDFQSPATTVKWSAA